MSFFDDEDDAGDQEPRRTARSSAPTRPREGGGGGRSGSGGRPPRPPRSGAPRRPADPAIERRRWVAAGVLVVIVILMILLISSCQARNTKNSLEDYNNNVSQLNTESANTGQTVFKDLRNGGSNLASNLATPLHSAQGQLARAQSLSVPGQMATAQRNFLLALRMRVDGITDVANNVAAGASSGSQASSAVGKIAGGMARFYASDVVYIDYTAREITQALHGDSIPVGSAQGAQTINARHFLTDLSWLSESNIESVLGSSVSSGGGAGSGKDAAAKCQTSTCVHGTNISAAAVGTNSMSTTAVNTVAGSPAPTFTLTFVNGGGYDEYDVGCSVSVQGGPSGTGTASGVTAPGATNTCTVKLSGPVSAGTYSVTATIKKVPLETNLSNNSETFQVNFT